MRGSTARRPYELAPTLKEEFQRWNVLGGMLLRDCRNVIVKAGDTTLVVTADPVMPGTMLQIGVRPEKLVLEADTAPAVETDRNVVTGVITDVSFTGVSTQYLVKTGWEQELTVFAQNRGEPPLPEGEAVRVTWRPENSFVIGEAAPAGTPAPVA